MHSTSGVKFNGDCSSSSLSSINLSFAWLGRFSISSNLSCVNIVSPSIFSSSNISCSLSSSSSYASVISFHVSCLILSVSSFFFLLCFRSAALLFFSSSSSLLFPSIFSLPSPLFSPACFLQSFPPFKSLLILNGVLGNKSTTSTSINFLFPLGFFNGLWVDGRWKESSLVEVILEVG